MTPTFILTPTRSSLSGTSNLEQTFLNLILGSMSSALVLVSARVRTAILTCKIRIIY